MKAVYCCLTYTFEVTCWTFLPWRNSPPVGQGVIIIEYSWSHSHTPHSVGLLWTSDQPVAETSKWQHSQETNIHAPGGFCLFVCYGATSPKWTRASSFTRFVDHTQRLTTVGRTPLEEWSARYRDLYLTTHNTHKRHTHLSPPEGFICFWRENLAPLRPGPPHSRCF